MNVETQERIEQFQRRLGETRAWCATQDWSASLAKGLRTPLLRPSEQSGSEQTFPDYSEFWKKTPEQRQQVVEQLAHKRAVLLQEQSSSFRQLAQPLSGGRLLVFNPDGTLSDGAATLATYGFFDEDNIPAWDTWVFYVANDEVNGVTPWHPWYPHHVFDSYLLCWVPELLVNTISDGIDVNPEECILWATNLDTAFIRLLKQAGFVV